ncbi:hypothetical protein MtrunA17_Chr3g0105611 [Medicago truncatula]|uniref:Uncharacterized protein n=1 Tax=Medicago truncatula TaxID=3880 RepID=A0A396ISS8_MEDTR|nr:hypothetical protein MtrunA17_Chr3g0105611 [Medicago truncatula]
MICFNSLHSSTSSLTNCGSHLKTDVEKTISNFSHPSILIVVRLLRTNEYLRPTKRHLIIGRSINIMSSKLKFICCPFSSLPLNSYLYAHKIY